MRVTVSHNKSKEEVRRAAEQAVDQLLHETPPGLMQITNPRKQWDGQLLRFWMTAKMGFIQNPIAGSIEVTDRDLTLDVDLGMLNALFPEQKVRAVLEERMKMLGPGKP